MKRGESPWRDIANISNRDIQIIFDVGANVGQTAKQLVTAFPSADIFSFEPVPSTFSQLEKKVKNLQNVKCLPFGFSDSSFSTDIFLQIQSGWNSIQKILIVVSVLQKFN